MGVELPCAQEGVDIVERRTLGCAHVVAREANASGEARFGGKPQLLGAAEACIKVIASSSGDDRVGLVGAFDAPFAIFGGACGALLGVNDNGCDVELAANLCAHALEGCFVFAVFIDVEHVADALAFLEVQTKNRVAVRFELSNDSKGFHEFRVCSFFGIGEIKEKAASAFDWGEAWQRFFQQAIEYARHIGNHGPIYEGQQAAFGELVEKRAFAHRVDYRIVGDVFESFGDSHHNFAIVEFDSVGEPRSRNRNGGSFLCKFLEYWVDSVLSERTNVSYRVASCQHGVGEYWTISAELVHLGIHLNVGAHSCCREHPVSKASDAVDPLEIVSLAVPLGYEVEDGVHESVEADHDFFSALIGSLFNEFFLSTRFIIHLLAILGFVDLKVGDSLGQSERVIGCEGIFYAL